MGVTLFGFLTVLLGLVCMAARPAMAVYLLMFLSIANAAGTFSIAGASIPPVNLFALFFFLRALNLPGGPAISVQSLAPPRTGFLLSVLIGYAVLTAIFYPRILQGATHIFYPDRSIEVSDTFLARPLTSGSGNITQSLYALQGLAVFAVAHVYARFVPAETFLRAFRYLALLNIGFALLDAITDSVGASFVMEPFRSGGYIIHSGQTVAGIRRIIGSFPEPSAFAAFSFQMFAGMFVMWQLGVGGRSTFAAMMGNLIAMVISTSTTGYAALTIFVMLIAGWLIFTLFRTGWTQRPQMAIFGLGLVGLLIAAMYVFDAVPASVTNILGETLNKSESASGIERAALNTQAWSNFTDTFGIGAGLGSAFASSFVFVLLSNLGIIGVVLFCLFLGKLLLTGPEVGSTNRAIFAIAISQIVATLICAAVSSTVFSLGVQFYYWAGLASAAAYAPVRTALTNIRTARAVP